MINTYRRERSASPGNAPSNRYSKLTVRRDLNALRIVTKRVRYSLRLAGFCLLDHKGPGQTARLLGRRSCYRSQIKIPIHVLPATFDGTCAEPLEGRKIEILAITDDVSRNGAGFLHGERLEGDHAIVTVDLLDGSPVSLLMEVRWSNIKCEDMYMSGGRFSGIAYADPV